MTLLRKNLTIVRLLTCTQIECNNNKRLFLCIDRLTIKIMHVITEISKLSTYTLALIFRISFGNEYIIYSITKYNYRKVH